MDLRKLDEILDLALTEEVSIVDLDDIILKILKEGESDILLELPKSDMLEILNTIIELNDYKISDETLMIEHAKISEHGYELMKNEVNALLHNPNLEFSELLMDANNDILELEDIVYECIYNNINAIAHVLVNNEDTLEIDNL